MKDYVVGFGDPSKEFWLGLDKLESLTEEGAELLIELETFEVRGHDLKSQYNIFLHSYRVKKPMQDIPVLRWKVQNTESMCLDILEMQEIQ